MIILIVTKTCCQIVFIKKANLSFCVMCMGILPAYKSVHSARSVLESREGTGSPGAEVRMAGSPRGAGNSPRVLWRKSQHS